MLLRAWLHWNGAKGAGRGARASSNEVHGVATAATLEKRRRALEAEKEKLFHPVAQDHAGRIGRRTPFRRFLVYVSTSQNNVSIPISIDITRINRHPGAWLPSSKV